LARDAQKEPLPVRHPLLQSLQHENPAGAMLQCLAICAELPETPFADGVWRFVTTMKRRY